jgi:hypothetical protein
LQRNREAKRHKDSEESNATYLTVVRTGRKTEKSLLEQSGGVIKRRKRNEMFNQTEAAAKNRRCSANPLA